MRTHSIIPIIRCTIVMLWCRPMTAFAQFCEPLPPPAGNVIHVDPSQTGNLTSIVSGTNPGDTILFADGTYPLNGVYLWVSTPSLTIRSASGNRDTLVERNILIDNARGVGFGLMTSGSARTYSDNPCPRAIGYVGHYNGIIRNNFIFQNRAELRDSIDGFDCGICLRQACGAKTLHNSVVAAAEPFSSIEWRFSNTEVEITNNLASHRMMERNDAEALLAGNYENAPLSLFLDVSTSDLHLAPNATDAIDQGVFIGSLCDNDIDGDNRDAMPDVGADEVACSTDFKGDSDVDGADLAIFAVNFDAACLESFADAFGN